MFTALYMELGLVYFMGRIYGALPAYSHIKNGSNDLINMIVVDKTEHDVYKLLLLLIAGIMVINQHSSFVVRIVLSVLNNGCPKGSLGPLYSSFGYDYLPASTYIHFKRYDEVDNHPV